MKTSYLRAIAAQLILPGTTSTRRLKVRRLPRERSTRIRAMHCTQSYRIRIGEDVDVRFTTSTRTATFASWSNPVQGSN